MTGLCLAMRFRVHIRHVVVTTENLIREYNRVTVYLPNKVLDTVIANVNVGCELVTHRLRKVGDGG